MSSPVPACPRDLTDWPAWISYGEAWARDGRSAVRDSGIREAGDAGLATGVDTWSAVAPAVASRPILRLHAYRENRPGARWRDLFDATWSAYRSWYLSGDAVDRPSLAEARRALGQHMPELLPTWLRLFDLTGRDPVAARLLTMWQMPALVAGCTQAVAPGDDPVLVRNYDYDLALFEGVVASTNWSGHRKVIGTSDLLWGLLDGVNEDGLAVSLTWGGRPGSGSGFGIPIVVRYVLETCASVLDVVAALRRIPVAQAYNLTIADTSGDHATVFVAPGEQPEVSRLRVAANHRLDDVRDGLTDSTAQSRERQAVATEVLLDHGHDVERLVGAFLEAPLRNADHSAGWGTLYTVVLEAGRGCVTYCWPGRRWSRRFDDQPEQLTVCL